MIKKIFRIAFIMFSLIKNHVFAFIFFCQKNHKVYCSRSPINRVINVLGGSTNVQSSNFNPQPISVHRRNQSLDCLRSQNLEKSCPLVRPFYYTDIESETFRAFERSRNFLRSRFHKTQFQMIF